MSRKTLRIKVKPVTIAMSAALMSLAYAHQALAELTCASVYFSSALFSQMDRVQTKQSVLKKFESSNLSSVQEITAPSLKDHLSIRAEAAKQGCGKVFVFQKSPDTSSNYITALLMETQTGKYLSEVALSNSLFDVFLSELSTWAHETAAITSVPLHLENLAADFYAARRCDDIERFMPDSTVCDGKSQANKTPTLKDPLRLAFKGLPSPAKHTWIEALQNSTFSSEAQQFFTQQALLFIQCEEACDAGTAKLTIPTGQGFLKFESDPTGRLSPLFSTLISIRNQVAKKLKTKPFVLSAILENTSGGNMSIRIEGTEASPKLYPSQSIKAFLKK